jgi:nucleotide-binding universal stress UspA family protein
MSRFHNILVAIDFSQTSEDVVAAAADLSRSNHAPLHLLHVVPDVQIPYAIEPVVFDFGETIRQSLDTARRQLADLAARYPVEAGPPTIEAVNGVPAAEIQRYAEEHAIDLIVLGAHGHGFLDRLLIGSVAERVAHHPPCAVLLVPRVARKVTLAESLAVAGAEA